MPNFHVLRHLIRNLARRPIYTIRFLAKPVSNDDLMRRWAPRDSLLSEWDSRTELIAELIPDGSSVIEFGAGRLVLKSLLGEKCVYVPSDIVDRGPGTLVIDLNTDDINLVGVYSHAVFSGVLEYIRDIPRLLDAISPNVSTIVASYESVDALPDLLTRRTNGWVSHLTERKFLEVFFLVGFKVSHTRKWREQKIYIFRKRQ
jgi:hypothetical protein